MGKGVFNRSGYGCSRLLILGFIVVASEGREGKVMGKRLVLVIMLCTLIVGYMPKAGAFPPITSPFGWRVHPMTGEWSFHSGVDLGMDYGSGIPAIWAGEVVFAGRYGGYGNAVILFHGGTIYTLYGHCDTLFVTKGMRVEQGQVIATVGSTGNSTGPHLHLELWRDGQYIDPITIWQR